MYTLILLSPLGPIHDKYKADLRAFEERKNGLGLNAVSIFYGATSCSILVTLPRFDLLLCCTDWFTLQLNVRFLELYGALSTDVPCVPAPCALPRRRTPVRFHLQQRARSSVRRRGALSVVLGQGVAGGRRQIDRVRSQNLPSHPRCTSLHPCTPQNNRAASSHMAFTTMRSPDSIRSAARNLAFDRDARDRLRWLLSFSGHTWYGNKFDSE